MMQIDKKKKINNESSPWRAYSLNCPRFRKKIKKKAYSSSSLKYFASL